MEHGGLESSAACALGDDRVCGSGWLTGSLRGEGLRALPALRTRVWKGRAGSREGGTPGGARSEGQGQEGQKPLAPQWQQACREETVRRRSRARRGQVHRGGRGGLHHLQTCRESPPGVPRMPPQDASPSETLGPRCQLEGSQGTRLTSGPASCLFTRGQKSSYFARKSLPRGNNICQNSEFSLWEFSGGTSASATWAGTLAASNLPAWGAEGRAETARGSQVALAIRRRMGVWAPLSIRLGCPGRSWKPDLEPQARAHGLG